MNDTPKLGLPYLAPAQAQKHVTHNEALRRLDAIVQLVAEYRTQTSPPREPEEGAVYIVAAPATGAFKGQEGHIAAWQDGAWSFIEPAEGRRAWVRAEMGLAGDDRFRIEVNPDGAA